MSSQLPPLSVYVPSPAQLDLTNSIGAMVVGVYIAMLLTGLSINQTLFYYRSFPNDPTFVKWTVAVACTLNLLHSILLPKSLYFWIVTYWGSISALDFVDWSYNVNLTVLGLLSLVVQVFFAWRVYVLGHRRLVIPIIICLISVAQAGWAIACTIMAFRLVRQSQFGSFTYGVDVWQYGSAAADIIIAGSVVYYLRTAKTDFSRTNSVIDKLIAVTLESNLLTAVISIIVAILFSTIRKWPNALNFVAARLYYISLMVNVNARHDLAKDLENSQQQFHMSPVNREGGSGKQNILSGIRVISKTTTITDQPYDGSAAFKPPRNRLSIVAPALKETDIEHDVGYKETPFKTPYSGTSFLSDEDVKKSHDSL